MFFAGKVPDQMRCFITVRLVAFLLLAQTAAIAGCSTSTSAPAATDTPRPTTVTSPAPAITATTTATASPSLLPPTATPTVTFSLCSPLGGYTLEQLPGMVSNPYNPPPPSRDDPHQGVDLAIIDPATGIALQGKAVQAVLSGQVALVIKDRFPYGNAILIETPLDELPAAWADQPTIPTSAPTITPHPALTCPQVESVVAPQTTRRSLYLLYAHMEQPSALQPGDPVGCGETIGTVGMTGNALNPHLHLEARVGPAGTRLESMAHYDASAVPEEMAAYCLWRVSGAFQRIDPLQLLLYNSSVSPSP